MFDRCLDNIYTLRYQQTLAALRHTQLTLSPSSLDTLANEHDDGDDDDVSMNSDLHVITPL